MNSCTGKAIVLATGGRTYFGAMAEKLVGERPPTAFDRGVRSVSWLLIRFSGTEPLVRFYAEAGR